MNTYNPVLFPETALFQSAKKILLKLVGKGHQAFIVGGAVRDLLLGRETADIDIATSATPDEVTSCFEKTIPTGIAHGTVSVFQDEFWYEVTTFRSEGPYKDGRRPMYVEFGVSIENDLARRDFTINALALDVYGTLLDPFNGYQDLHLQQIRSVGDANARFREDGLRVARAYRLAATLKFAIALETEQAILQEMQILGKVSMERRQAEWNRFLSAADQTACESLPDRVVESWIGWPNVQFSQFYKELIKLPGLQDRLAFLAWQYEKEFELHPSSRGLLQQMLYSKKVINEATTLIRIAKSWENHWPEYLTLEMNEAIAKYGELFLDRSIRLSALNNPDFLLHNSLKHAKEIQADCPIRGLQDLAVNGKEIAEVFAISGPAIRKALEFLYTQVVRYKVPNQRENLLQSARRFIMNTQTLTALDIRTHLKVAPTDIPIHYYDQIPSTSDVAREKIASSDAGMLAVITDNQVGGRGRQGRAWHTPAGKGLAVSLAAHFPKNIVERLQEWPLLMAIAVRRAIVSLQIADVMIKWPNDILIRGKKVCGILTEMGHTEDSLYIVVGIGINVHADLDDFPSDIQDKVISLKLAANKTIASDQLVAKLIDEYYQMYQTTLVGKSFSSFREEYTENCISLGKNIRIQQGSVVTEGQAYAIDDNGTLWIYGQTGDSLQIRSGEIIETHDDK